MFLLERVLYRCPCWTRYHAGQWEITVNNVEMVSLLAEHLIFGKIQTTVVMEHNGL